MAAPNPYASYEASSVDTQFRMGPSFDANPTLDYWWNYEWPDGTFSASTEPAGWEGLNYILPMDQVGGRDGALVGPQSVGPKELEIEALIVSPTAALLRQHIAKVRRLLGPEGLPGPRRPIVWEQYDFGTGRRLALVTRPQGGLVPVVIPGVTEGGLAVAMRFQLVASKPWKYQAGLVEANQVGLRNPALVGGRTYDKTYDYTYGSSSPAGGTMICINNGDLPTYPIFRVTGPVDFPIITNATTGLSFQVNRDMLVNETVIIDSSLGTVSPASVRLNGRPFPLAPGANTITWRSATDTYQAAALLRLEWRSTSR